MQILCIAGEAAVTGQQVPLHQEVAQLVRDRKPCPPIAISCVGQDRTGTPNGICEQHAFKAVKYLRFDISDIQRARNLTDWYRRIDCSCLCEYSPSDIRGFVQVIQINPGKLQILTLASSPRLHCTDCVFDNSAVSFGFTNPVLIDQRRTILAGHGRVEGAKLLGMTEVPCLRLDHMNEDAKRAYVLADNKLVLNAGWDEDLLAAELGALMSADLDFDVSITGFSIPEIDGVLEAVAPEEPGDPDDDVLPREALARARLGDVWQLGRHRLICGDALDPAVIGDLMEGEVARMVFSDPPYNVPIDGHVGNSGKIQHREFVMASGEMSEAEFTGFLERAFRNLADHSADGSIHFICMDWRHMSGMMAAGKGVYTEFKNLIVWVKDNGGMGTFYRSRHELIFAFKKSTASHVNNFELGQHGRYRTNVWEYRGVNSRHAGRMEELALHPTVKPVQMIADAIRDVSARGDIVLDSFGGSGSTLIAAEKTGRRGYLCEIDPIYCDRILARWEAYSKDEADQLVCGWPLPEQTLEAAE